MLSQQMLLYSLTGFPMETRRCLLRKLYKPHPELPVVHGERAL